MRGDRVAVSAGNAYVEGAFRRNIVVVCEAGVITDILTGDNADAIADARQYKCDLLLPGLINAHCHLELTGLAGKLPRGNVPFGKWLDEVVTRGRKDMDYVSAVRDGMEALAAGGCTCVFDCSTVPADQLDEVFANSLPLRVFQFHEILGLTEESAAHAISSLGARLAWSRTRDGVDGRYVGGGVNPHAPYSVGTALRAGLRKLFDDGRHTCAWHLCESSDEDMLFRNGSGSLAEFLLSRGLPLPFEKVPGCGPAEFLDREQLLSQCDLAFHMNYPEDGLLETFRPPRAVVHCPGTHRFFNRPPFPMREMLDAGVNVCLGTDSLASSDSLDMLEVIRMAHMEFPWLRRGELLDMVTTNPAKTKPLVHHNLGILAIGKTADFTLLQGDCSELDPEAALLTRNDWILNTVVA